MDPELRSVLRRYSLVFVVLAGAVTWAVLYTNAMTAPKASAPAPAPEAESAAAPPAAAPRAPSLSSLLVTKDGTQRVACEPACRLEEYCGLRDLASCQQTSCDGDVRKLSTSDFPFARAETCAQAAAAPCEEACWKRGECTGDHSDDTRCTNACLTLVQQKPEQTFRESRCVIESRCGDLPLCLHVER